jgi:hypothetical protein
MDEPTEVSARPDDPVARFRGRFKRAGTPTTAQMCAEEREDEIEAESVIVGRDERTPLRFGSPSGRGRTKNL